MRLVLEAVSCAYGGVDVVRDASLSLSSGEILCLLGRNGAGKTTTLKAVMGLLRPTRGSIRLDGRELTALPAHAIPRLGIGYVPQGRRLFPRLTVAENLRIGLLATGQGEARLGWVLDLFPELRDRLRQPAGTLSGGQQQMVATARALCMDPTLLLMDEPTQGLMPALAGRVLETLRVLRDRRVGVLLVEQRFEAALEVADRVAFMENGTIVHHLTRDAAASHPEVFARYLGVRQG